MSIGIARMDESNTIVLELHAHEEDLHGEAQLVYPPDHPSYADILAHVGELSPGESREVYPWQEEYVA